MSDPENSHVKEKCGKILLWRSVYSLSELCAVILEGSLCSNVLNIKGIHKKGVLLISLDWLTYSLLGFCRWKTCNNNLSSMRLCTGLLAPWTFGQTTSTIWIWQVWILQQKNHLQWASLLVQNAEIEFETRSRAHILLTWMSWISSFTSS